MEYLAQSWSPVQDIPFQEKSFSVLLQAALESWRGGKTQGSASHQQLAQSREAKCLSMDICRASACVRASCLGLPVKGTERGWGCDSSVMLWETESGQRRCYCCSPEEWLPQRAQSELRGLSGIELLVHFLPQGQYTGLMTSWGAFSGIIDKESWGCWVMCLGKGSGKRQESAAYSSLSSWSPHWKPPLHGSHGKDEFSSKFLWFLGAGE